MNDIVAQAQAQWSTIATECATELAEAETRLAKAQAEAARHAEELKKSTAKLAAAFERELKKGTDAYPVETFSFGPDPDNADEDRRDATERVPQQAPVPSPPGRRRPAAADDEASPRIFNEDSW